MFEDDGAEDHDDPVLTNRFATKEPAQCPTPRGSERQVSELQKHRHTGLQEMQRSAEHEAAHESLRTEETIEEPLTLPRAPEDETAPSRTEKAHSKLPLGPFLPLYAAYGLVCGVQRAFTFVVPIFLMVVSQRALNRADGSFLPAAIYMLSTRGACFLLGPTVGKLLDWSSRFKAAATASILYGLSTFLCALWMPWLARVRPELPTNSIPPGTIWFCIFGTFAALSEFALEISLWKRWLPLTVRAQLAQSGSAGSMKFEEPLATANARMRRITMTIDIGMPLLVGWLLSSRGDVLGSILVARLGAMLLAMQLGALYIASKTCARGESSSVTPASSVTEMQVTTKERDITANGDMITERQVSKFLAAARVSYQRLRGLFSSWRLYYEQKVFVASLAHVSLYFTVLSPGGLLFGFLTYCGVSGRIIGLFRAASAVMGILATFSFEILVSRMHRSVLAVGRLGVVCQLACLLPALLLLWLVPVPGEPLQSATTPGLMPRLQPSIVLVGALLFVVLSRWGLWCWDSAETEIMQTMVDAHAVSEVSAVEAALCALAELVMYSVSLVFSNPRKFPVLATMSALSVSTGAIIFHRWTKLQDRREEHPQGTVAESPAPNESPV